jgi:hypothetical protein
MPAVRSPVSWYRREDYERIRRMMNDANNFPETFDEWLYLAEKQFAQAVARGFVLEKVIIDPDRFDAFCRMAKIKPNMQARVQYAATTLDREKPGHG